MMFPAPFHSYWVSALASHLWQSTVFVLVVWLLTLVLRRNQARTRYFLWLIASVKFLVPFSILIAAGEWLHPATAPGDQGPTFVNVMGDFPQPLSAGEGAAHAVAIGTGPFLATNTS